MGVDGPDPETPEQEYRRKFGDPPPEKPDCLSKDFFFIGNRWQHLASEPGQCGSPWHETFELKESHWFPKAALAAWAAWAVWTVAADVTQRGRDWVFGLFVAPQGQHRPVAPVQQPGEPTPKPRSSLPELRIVDGAGRSWLIVDTRDRPAELVELAETGSSDLPLAVEPSRSADDSERDALAIEGSGATTHSSRGAHSRSDADFGVEPSLGLSF